MGGGNERMKKEEELRYKIAYNALLAQLYFLVALFLLLLFCLTSCISLVFISGFCCAYGINTFAYAVYYLIMKIKKKKKVKSWNPAAIIEARRCIWEGTRKVRRFTCAKIAESCWRNILFFLKKHPRNSVRTTFQETDARFADSKRWLKMSKIKQLRKIISDAEKKLKEKNLTWWDPEAAPIREWVERETEKIVKEWT